MHYVPSFTTGKITYKITYKNGENHTNRNVLGKKGTKRVPINYNFWFFCDTLEIFAYFCNMLEH